MNGQKTGRGFIGQTTVNLCCPASEAARRGLARPTFHVDSTYAPFALRRSHQLVQYCLSATLTLSSFIVDSYSYCPYACQLMKNPPGIRTRLVAAMLVTVAVIGLPEEHSNR